MDALSTYLVNISRRGRPMCLPENNSLYAFGRTHGSAPTGDNKFIGNVDKMCRKSNQEGMKLLLTFVYFCFKIYSRICYWAGLKPAPTGEWNMAGGIFLFSISAAIYSDFETANYFSFYFYTSKGNTPHLCHYYNFRDFLIICIRKGYIFLFSLIIGYLQSQN